MPIKIFRFLPFLLLSLLSPPPAGAQGTTDFATRFTAEELREAPAELIPFPRELEWSGEWISLTGWQVEGTDPSPSLTRVLKEIAEENGWHQHAGTGLTITLLTDVRPEQEGYSLAIAPDGIEIAAATEAGHYYALQTLRQLIRQREGKTVLPLCRIGDAPAFPVRGFMIDVGRNFQPLAALKRQLDLMARYKLNTFQWHLTDRPAWRIESRRYPELTIAANHRPTRDPGLFYTYAEIRELVRYARERHITVIPEIDMPGHSDSFVTGMGVKMESARGMQILEDVLTEFFREIPATDCPIIHIGSDEVEIPNPKAFMDRMVAFCEAHDREVVVWNPGLPAPPSVIRQTWRPAPPAETVYREIDSWNSYINNGEPMTQVQRLFFKPIGSGSDNEVLGGILCLWPDVNLARPEDAFAQNPVYPSLLTYAWTTWTADVLRAPETYFMQLPPPGTPAAAYFAAFEDILLAHRERHFAALPFPYLRQSDKHWKLTGPFDTDPGPQLLRADRDSFVHADQTFTWRPATGNTLVVKDRFRLGGHFPDATAGQTVYALTYVHSDRDRIVNTWIGFETPMRSNRTYTGIPAVGQWDANGGAVWVNDSLLSAPDWDNPGWKPSRSNGWATPAEQEIPWTAEELYWTRPPARVSLRKGWNQILVRIPGAGDYHNWMFTFAPPDMDGLRFATQPISHSTYYEQRRTHFESLPDTEGEIVLVGDSMTDGAEWAELLGNGRVRNRGISGDVTQGILDRLAEVTRARPTQVFLLIGTNDLAHGHTPEYVVDNIRRIVTRINAESPQTEIFVQSIFPVNDRYGLFTGHTDKGDAIAEINTALAAGAGGKYRYLDLHSRFTDAAQKLDTRYTNDGLHLNGAGYRLWASLLQPHLRTVE